MKICSRSGVPVRLEAVTDHVRTDWRRAIYHHRRLVSDPNVSDKEARSAANCMVLHPDCHPDPVDFYRLHGFFPDNLRRK